MFPIRRAKYRNKMVGEDGQKYDKTRHKILFHSIREWRRWTVLKLLEQAGKIKDLYLQVPYTIRVNNQVICEYRADFKYLEETSTGRFSWVVEDCKGYKTPEYILKKKLMKACLGIEIRET
jgi:hypothetical protein